MRRRWLGLLLLAGCGPIEYITVVTVEAPRAVTAAERARAAERAPYEMTAAREYLHKARELGGQSRYEEAVALGRRALALGALALQIAEKRP